MSGDILAVLREVNFTEYEAKAYLALLEEAPLTGYGVARRSGVPRSKIYEVLAGLAARGEVLVSHESPAKYSPLPPDLLLAGRRRQAEASFSRASEALRTFGEAGRNRENIWNISGREAILDRVRDVLERAERRILMEIWPEEAEALEQALRRAAARGVEIIIVVYGELKLDYCTVHTHDASEEITEEYGGRWVVVSVDSREVVAGTLSLGADSRAAWTGHPGLVIPITEVIVHDLYIVEIMALHRDLIEASFGPNLLALRQRYNVDSSGMSIAQRLGLGPSRKKP